MSAMLQHRAAERTERRTALPAAHYERELECRRCKQLVAVFEAAHGGDHEWLEPRWYVCGDCCDRPKGRMLHDDEEIPF